MVKRKPANLRIQKQKAETHRTKELFKELMRQEVFPFPAIRQPLSVPNTHGVYVIMDKGRRVLHVGRTYRGSRGLWQRLNNHLNGQSSFVNTYLEKNRARLRKGYSFKFLPVKLDRRRALLEHYAVGMLSPAHLGLGKALNVP